MNKDNAKQFLPLVQALADGKTIQILDDGKWRDFLSKEIGFSFHHEQYRIKPEPIEMDVWYAPRVKLITDNDMSQHGDNWIKCRATLTPY